MGRLRAAAIVLVLAACAALVVSGCGSSDAKLLPGKTADQINSNLDSVRALVAEGDCVGAEDAVAEVSDEVDSLSGVDGKLKAALRQGANRLGVVVVACGEKAEEEAAEEQQQLEDDEEAEQEELEAVEGEEEELAEEKEDKQQAKAQEKAAKEVEKEQKASEKEAEKEAEKEKTEPLPPSEAEGTETGNGPPAETPGGTEPPAGGVGPGAQVE
jgi:outer membrane biosynthesis protein TonB